MEWHRILPNRQQPKFGASESRHLSPRTRDCGRPSFSSSLGVITPWLADTSWDRGSCRSLFSRSSVSSLHWSDIQGDWIKEKVGSSQTGHVRILDLISDESQHLRSKGDAMVPMGGAVREKPQTGKKVKIKNMSHLQALVPSHHLFHLDFSLSRYTAWWWTSCTPSAPPLFEPPDSPTLAWVWRGRGLKRGPGRRGCSGGTQTPLVSRQGWPNAPNRRQSRRRVSNSQTRRDRFVSPVSRYGNDVNT